MGDQMPQALMDAVLPSRHAFGWVILGRSSTNTACTAYLEERATQVDGSETGALAQQCQHQEERQYAPSLRRVGDERILGHGASALVECVWEQLQQDAEDACRDGETAPDPRAAKVCVDLSKRVAPHVALAPHLKWAAFTEDDGGVSLVMQSLVTDRRINCRIRPDASAVSAIRIDEHMHADTIAVSLTNPNIGRELAEWVISRR